MNGTTATARQINMAITVTIRTTSVMANENNAANSLMNAPSKKGPNTMTSITIIAMVQNIVRNLPNFSIFFSSFS